MSCTLGLRRISFLSLDISSINNVDVGSPTKRLKKLYYNPKVPVLYPIPLISPCIFKDTVGAIFFVSETFVE